MGPDRLEPLAHANTVSWIRERLQPLTGWLPVGAFVPRGFDGCTRLLHPAYLNGVGQVPWSRVAEWSRRPLTPTSFFRDLGTRPDGTRWMAVGDTPRAGELDPGLTSKLAEVLAAFTSTPEACWFCVWHGWGDILVHEDSLVDISPQFRASGRRYALYGGSVRRVTDLLRLGPNGRFRSPSFWWPADRAWFVSTEVDAESTYVAGSTALIERLIAAADFETFRATLSDPFDGTHEGQETW